MKNVSAKSLCGHNEKKSSATIKSVVSWVGCLIVSAALIGVISYFTYNYFSAFSIIVLVLGAIASFMLIGLYSDYVSGEEDTQYMFVFFFYVLAMCSILNVVVDTSVAISIKGDFIKGMGWTAFGLFLLWLAAFLVITIIVCRIIMFLTESTTKESIFFNVIFYGICGGVVFALFVMPKFGIEESDRKAELTQKKAEVAALVQEAKRNTNTASISSLEKEAYENIKKYAEENTYKKTVRVERVSEFVKEIPEVVFANGKLRSFILTKADADYNKTSAYKVGNKIITLSNGHSIFVDYDSEAKYHNFREGDKAIFSQEMNIVEHHSLISINGGNVSHKTYKAEPKIEITQVFN